MGWLSTIFGFLAQNANRFRAGTVQRPVGLVAQLPTTASFKAVAAQCHPATNRHSDVIHPGSGEEVDKRGCPAPRCIESTGWRIRGEASRNQDPWLERLAPATLVRFTHGASAPCARWVVVGHRSSSWTPRQTQSPVHLIADKPHYVKLSTPFLSDESRTSRVTSPASSGRFGQTVLIPTVYDGSRDVCTTMMRGRSA
jgi:hypothetical protein